MRWPIVLAASLACGLSGCTAPPVAPATAPVTAPSPVGRTSPSPSSTSPSSVPTSTPAHPARLHPLRGRTVVVDPGHNGIWTRALLRRVPAGNGRTKPCNSSGTASNAGYPEHAFTFDVATRLAARLRGLGATVVLTRPDDHGLGPCVNVRAAIANRARADLLISIHADGDLARGARGFHVIVSTTMAGGAEIEARSLALARTVRRELQAGTAMPRSTYVGHGTALSLRTDIAGLNLSQRVGVMVELGNMRSAADMALIGSTDFRRRVAASLAAAVVDTLQQ